MCMHVGKRRGGGEGDRSEVDGCVSRDQWRVGK